MVADKCRDSARRPPPFLFGEKERKQRKALANSFYVTRADCDLRRWYRLACAAGSDRVSTWWVGGADGHLGGQGEGVRAGAAPSPPPSHRARGRGSKAGCPVRAVPCALSRTRERAGVRAPSAALINRNPPAPTAARKTSRPGWREGVAGWHPGKKSPPCPSPPGGRVSTACCPSQSAGMT